MSTENIVNIVSLVADEGQTKGFVTIFRPISSEHQDRLMEPNEYDEKVVAQASPLACLIAEVNNPQFCEKYGYIATWVGMELEH